MSGQRKGMSLSKKHNLTGWLFLAPAVILIGWMSFYPMIQAFILSMQKGLGTQMSFSGFDNYARILKDPTFKQTLFNTFFYLIIQVPVMLVLALALASMLNNKDLRGKGFFRTCIFLPCATSLVSYSMIFRSMFANDGFINTVLRAVGASPLQTFFKITVPLLKPTILLTTITSTNGTLQLFDESLNLTNGGPGKSTMTMSHYIYNTSFVQSPNFGYAAAMSIIILIMVAILAVIQMKVGDER